MEMDMEFWESFFFFLGLSGIVQEEWLGWELGRAVYTTPTAFYHIISYIDSDIL
jgi:predicted cation transporter